MNKIKETVITILIIGLAVMSVFTFIQLRETQKVFAALLPDNLVIIPLYNGVANRTGATGLFDEWSVIPEYDASVATFAVLPAGGLPYTWSLDDPSIMNLTPSAEGFLVKGVVQKVGKTTLRVQSATGLQGELKISTERMPGPLPQEEVTPPLTPPLTEPSQ